MRAAIDLTTTTHLRYSTTPACLRPLADSAAFSLKAPKPLSLNALTLTARLVSPAHIILGITKDKAVKLLENTSLIMSAFHFSKPEVGWGPQPLNLQCH